MDVEIRWFDPCKRKTEKLRRFDVDPTYFPAGIEFLREQGMKRIQVFELLLKPVAARKLYPAPKPKGK